jgi:prepilin-type N-terminal cleavage/methylation domain-containing protein
MLDFFKENQNNKNSEIMDEGYTLIEVLITMVIMGFILVVVNMVLVSLIRVSYDTDVRMNVRQDIEFALELMRRDVKSADPTVWGASNLGKRSNLDLVMAGSGEEVRFVCAGCSEDDESIGVLKVIRGTGPDGRSLNLTSAEDTNVRSFNVELARDDFSGTVEILITIEADSVQTKTNEDPVVKDVYKQISIITKGQEL